MKVQGYGPVVAARARALADLAARARGVPGAFVECGVQHGFSAAIIADALGPRDVWLFDSFKGLPKPGGKDGLAATRKWERKQGTWCLGSVDNVLERFDEIGWPPERLHVMPGWFHKTLRTANVGPIAFLHLDADLYASTLACLRKFWDSVVLGGIVRIDDYHHWPGCKQATDEFLRGRGLEPTEMCDPRLEYWYTIRSYP